ncbi:MAG TPA: cupredoxin domain-containing protein [Patescibacteria group bacterium]
MNRPLIIGIVAVLAVVAVAFAQRNRTSTISPTNTPTAQVTVTTTLETTATPSATTVTTVSPTTTTTHDVTFNGQAFSPRSLTIKVGDTVRFLNNGSQSIWVASDPHPVHTKYSAFDAERGYAPGETYSFTFTKAGTWTYHNHLNSSQTGTIVVE